MDFEFTSEQTQLADAVRRFVQKDYTFDARKAIVRSASGTSDAVWQQLVDLGLTALAMPEAQGGYDGGALDLLPVMQELGRGLVAEPLLATLHAAELIAQAGAAQHDPLIARVAEGSAKLAAALGEAQSRYELFAPQTVARSSGDGYVIDGHKSVVPYGAQAHVLVVSALLDGQLALFVVDGDAAGVVRHDRRVLDGQRVADIAFTAVAVDRSALLGTGEAAREWLDAANDYAVVLVCAEAIGVMEALNAATLDYAKTRKQFGQPIARFQVLQHRMVDMFMHVEQARSMAYLAAAKVQSTSGDERRRIVSAAKVRIGQAARFVGQQAVQIHGGMGVTDELPAAHLFKRLTMIEFTLGDTDHHLQRFIAASRSADRDAVVPVGEESVAAPLQRAA